MKLIASKPLVSTLLSSNPFRASMLACYFCALWQGVPASSQAQSNIVFNGGFEQADSGWSWGGSLEIHPNSGAPEGTIFVSVDTYLFQDLTTVAGRDYVLSFAADPSWSVPAVTWGTNPIAALTNFA